MPTLADAERAHIQRVLDSVGWNKKEAARVLAISRGTLYRKIEEYGLDPGERQRRGDRGTGRTSGIAPSQGADGTLRP